MIAIKGMDKAGGCGVCSGLCKDVYPYICYRCDIEFTEAETNLIIDLPGLTSKKCKLVALPEENKDMSWEELVEKVCNEIKEVTAVKFSGDGFDFEYKGIWFNKIGTIIYGNQKIENKTFYQMYQIIKALGDER